MEGKVCLVTGASSGIGKATATGLAEMGATVYLLCRNETRCESTMTEIRNKTGNQNIHSLIADFESFKSVRSAASEFVSTKTKLHVLVNNAGLFKATHSLTEDGFETTFQVNYLSHFLLTNLLLGILVENAPSRIINVTSIGHFQGHIGDPYSCSKEGSGMGAYSNSKLAQVLFTYELARRMKGSGVTSNCVHPGTVATNIWSRPLGGLGFISNIAKPFMKSPNEGARGVIYLSSSPDLQQVSGNYFDGIQQASSSQESHDEGLQARLWEASETMCGLKSNRSG